MKIAVDVSPISSHSTSGHKVRGVGKYIELLKDNLPKYDTKNEYVFLNDPQRIPSDISLIHYPYFELFFQSLPLIKSHKTVVTVHDLTPIKFKNNFPVGLKGAALWNLQKFLLSKVDKIAADSAASQSDIISFTHVPKEKIDVVYLATDGSFQEISDTRKLDAVRKKYKLPDSFVMYVGDATWNKNLPNLIRAIKEINLTLVMVGKTIAQTDFDRSNPWNHDRVELEKLIADDARFIKLGFVPDEDLVSLYNIADVFVMPSQYEGFGLPILEAMQSGCPVVTTEEGSIPEVAGDAVCYVDPNDISDIANGIGEVFFSPEKQRTLRRKGHAQSAKFSIEKMIQDMVHVYESVQ